MARIAALTFDAGGTLFSNAEPVGETYARLARRAGIEASAGALETGFQLAFAAAPPLVAPIGSSAVARLDAELGWWREIVRSSLAHALRDAAEPFPDERFEPFFAATFAHYAAPEAWRLHEDVGECLEGLAHLGLAIGILSNFDSRLHALVDALGLRRGPVLASTEIGHAKPAPEAFAAAARALGREPAACVHVGDSLEADALGARTAGFTGVWLDRAGRAATPPEGVLTIRSLRELPGLLASLDGARS